MIQRYIGTCGGRAAQFFFMAWLVGAAGFTAMRAEPTAATYTGPGSDFGTAANWGGVTPGPTQDLVVDQNATLVVSGSQQTRNLDVIAGTTGITLNTSSVLILNSLENGTLSVGAGAVLGVTGAGTLQVAVIEAGGALNLATTTTLDGGANPNPSRDGSSPSAVTRYGLVVLGGGTATLQSGANVTVAQLGKAVGVRVGEGAGTGILAVQAGSNLTVGTATDRGFFVVGDFGGTGVVNQTGGTVSVVGAVNVGSQGGTGTYNLSGGTFNVGLFEDGSDSNGFSVGARRTGSNGAPNGTLNISGTGELILTRGYLLVGGDTSPTSGGTGVVNQTGGLVRIIKDGLALGSGASGTANGTYNLNGGVLELGGTNGIQGGGSGGGSYAFNFGGGTLRVIGSNLITGISANLVDDTVSFIDTNGLAATWSGAIDGAQGGLVKMGTGTFTFGGNVERSIGYLNADEGGMAHAAGTTTVTEFVVGSNFPAGGGAAEFTLSGGHIIISGSIPAAPTPTFRVGDFGGTGVFNQTGGTVTVGSASETASLNIGNQGGTGTYNLSGGTLELANGINVIGRSAGSNPASTGTLNISGASTLLELKNGSSLIIGNNANRPAHGTGVVNQTGGTVRVTDGTIFVAGFGDGTYSLTGGTLEVGGDSLRARYNNTTSTSVFNFGGGTIKVINSDLDTDVRAVLVEGTVSTVNTNGFNATFANGFAGSGGFAKTGVGAMTLNGTTNLQAASSVIGVLKVGAGASKTGTLNLSDTLTVQVTTAVGRLQVGVDGGTGTANFTEGASFVIDDAAAAGGWGTLDIGRGSGSTGVLNHSGGTVDVSGGALQIGYSGGNGTYHLSGDGTLSLGEDSSIFIGSGANASGLLTIADNAVLTADSQVFVGAGAGATGTITQTGGSVTFTGPIVAFGTDSDETSHSPGTGIYNLNAGALLFEGIVQGVRVGDSAYGGTGEFNQSGGTVTLTNTTLRVGAHGSYNQSGGVIEVGGTNLTGSGAYRFGGGTIKVVGSALTTGLNSTLTTGKILTVDTNGFGATFSGSFTGGGGLTKTGEGVLRLTGTSNYSGATTISNGTFRVDGVLSNTTITVGSGATLTGHGTVAHVNILNGGRVDLGDTTGVLNATGNFSLGDTSHLLLKIASAADYDKITIGGELTAGGTFEVVFVNGFNPLGEASFSLLVAQSYDGEFGTLVLPDLAAGFEWNTDALNSAGVLSIVGTAIPESETWAVLAGVAALALALGRRRSADRRSS